MKWILSFLLLAACAFAQSPDCSFTASFTSATPGTAQPNKATSTGGTPCVYWTFTYWTNGATGVSIKLEGTNDSGGSPGASYTALTAIQGTSNPATGTNQGGAVLCCDSYPWVRLNPTIFTGSSQTMIARAYGWRTPPGGGVTSAGGTQNVNLIEVGGSAIALGQTTMSASLPVAIASDQSPIPFTASVSGCSKTFVNLSGSGNTQILAGSGTKNIYICDLEFSTATPENFKLTEGTGVNCAMGTADASALLLNISAWSLTPGNGIATATGGDALCANQANPQAAAVTLWYLQQ